jgi:hypothetical protein
MDEFGNLLLLRVDNSEAIQSLRTSCLIDANFNCEISQAIQNHSEKTYGG